MEKKYIVIVGIVIFIFLARYSLYPLFTNGNGSSKEYQSIENLEKDLDITTYHLYDMEEFIVHDDLVSIKNTSKEIDIWVTKMQIKPFIL